MESLNDLKKYLYTILNDRGLMLCKEIPFYSRFNLTGIEEEVEEDDLIYTQGLYLSIEETYRSNGSNSNTSYYISIIMLKRFTGIVYNKIKLSYKDSLKKITRLTNQIIDEYLNLI